MKKVFLILITVVGYALSVNAQPSDMISTGNTNNIPVLLMTITLLIGIICLITSFVWQKQGKVVFISKGEAWVIIIGGILGVLATLFQWGNSYNPITTYLWIGVGVCFIICAGFSINKNKGVGTGKIITMIVGKACVFYGFILAGLIWLAMEVYKASKKIN